MSKKEKKAVEPVKEAVEIVEVVTPTEETKETVEDIVEEIVDEVPVNTEGETVAGNLEVMEEVVKSDEEDRNSLIEIKHELVEVVHNGKNYHTTRHKEDLIYIPSGDIVRENDKVFVPLWLYKIKFK
jgi:hypothetical protein